MLWHYDGRYRYPWMHAGDCKRQGALAELAEIVRLTDAKVAEMLEYSVLMTIVFRDGTLSACIVTASGKMLTSALFNAFHKT
jgi:hypothetical protein